MATNRSYIRRPHRTRLTHDQELDLWLGCGPIGDPQPFASAEARQAAWARHREHLIRKLPSSPGRRPMAWWQYEAAIPWPGYDRERSTLYSAGLLGEDEKTELEAEWRREFERGQQRGFFFCSGPNKYYSGAVARRELYRWADIPLELVKRWTTGRQH